GKPITFPNLALADFGIPEADVLNVITDFQADPDGDFNDSMSSVRFDGDWITEIAGKVEESRQRTPPTLEGVTCADPRPRPTPTGGSAIGKATSR
ncbi:MAG: hypothetical protein ACRDHY_18115, partial [Anaerolineales bacterium]